MRGAVIRQRDPRLVAGQRYAVESVTERCRGRRHLDFRPDLVARGAVAEDDLEAGPCPRNAGIEKQATCPAPETPESIRGRAVHPSGRAGVPGPSAAPDMRRHGIEIGADDIGLDLVAVALASWVRA